MRGRTLLYVLSLATAGHATVFFISVSPRTRGSLRFRCVPQAACAAAAPSGEEAVVCVEGTGFILNKDFHSHFLRELNHKTLTMKPSFVEIKLQVV